MNEYKTKFPRTAFIIIAFKFFFRKPNFMKSQILLNITIGMVKLVVKAFAELFLGKFVKFPLGTPCPCISFSINPFSNVQ